MYVCPKCHRQNEVAIPAGESTDKLIVACDFCGATRKLWEYEHEFRRQELRQAKQAQKEADERLRQKMRAELEAQRGAKREAERAATESQKKLEAERAAEIEAERRRITGIYEYKVEILAEGLLGTMFLGSSKMPQKKIEDALNRHGQHGWKMTFMVIEQRRMLLFWHREAIVITFSRKIA